MAFYSRYYIHELLLVFFAFLTLAAAWRYWRSRRVGWALLGWSGVALMHATKETFVLSMAATGLALALNLAWNRWLDAGAPPQRPWRLNWRHMAAGFICGTAIIIVLFSSFFTNASGLLDSLRTFQPWLSRAEGASPHIHPWHFYLHRLLLFHDPKGPVWSEAVIAILGMAGAVAGIRRAGLGQAHAGFVRFVTFYTLSLTAIYSAIPYKTPWCLTGFWHGMILLAGVGAAALLEWAGSRRWKWGVQLCLLAGATQLAWQAWASDVPYAADRRNPYIYSQTSPDILDLVHEVEALAGAGPDGRRMVIKVMAPESDYWPLPWYLRRFTNVGWWSSVPDDPFAPMMIVSAKFHAGLDEKKTHLMPRYFQLRPGVFLELYVELDLWRAYLAKRPSE
jgi:uncharacterized protein (TIGR03663 family)